MRTGSLCSGYTGLDMAVHAVLGGELAWVADNDTGAAAILAHRYPDVPNLGDITAVDWSAVEPVDILCAGFPCQDISAAGKRAGLQHGTRSGLWHEIASAIGILRPPLVVIENVRALLTARGDEPTPEHLRAENTRDACIKLLTWLDREHDLAISKGNGHRVQTISARTVRVMGLRKRAVARCQWHEQRLVRAIGTVLGSLADLRYDAQWTVLSAADVGAAHKRERVFIAAWPAANPVGGELQRRRGPGELAGEAGEAGEATRTGSQRQRDGHTAWCGSPDAADTAGERAPAAQQPRQLRGPELAVQDPDCPAGSERREPASGQAPGGRPRADTGGPGRTPVASDAERDGLPGRCQGTPGGPDEPGEGPRSAAAGCGPGAAADTERLGLEGRERADGTYEGRRQATDSGGLRPLGGSCPPAYADSGSVDGRPDQPVGQQDRRAAAVGDSRVSIAWGAYEPAIRRWESATGRPAPRPVEPGRTGERLSPAFVEWMMGLPEGWVTGVPGLTRNAQLKALGNGVVPPQAELALRLLLADVLEAAA